MILRGGRSIRHHRSGGYDYAARILRVTLRCKYAMIKMLLEAGG